MGAITTRLKSLFLDYESPPARGRFSATDTTRARRVLVFIKRFALCDSFYSSKLAYTEEDDIELRVRCPGRGNIVEVAMLAYTLIHNCEPNEIPVGRDHGNSVAWPERSSNLAAKQD